MLSTTDNLFSVIVPVLSKQIISIEAASSTESSLVTNAPFFASSVAPTDCTMVSTAGSATGIAAKRKITTKVRVNNMFKCIRMADTATKTEAVIPIYIMYFTTVIITDRKSVV